ncbi:autophagy protein 12, partial [Scheffersomyces xylosifermentans]|uniref:autophagy protein 12 n=1 Tax=Scheffersomyces xylosifermentans TaxID=1304137 RepID=UPI00315CF251
KITIRFVPIGSTPRITSAVFTISSNQTVSTLTKFLGKMLKTKEHVYVYIQNSFQPNPDEKLNDLYHLFKTNNELIVSYCQSVAFG